MERVKGVTLDPSGMDRQTDLPGTEEAHGGWCPNPRRVAGIDLADAQTGVHPRRGYQTPCIKLRALRPADTVKELSTKP
jgi:hypothetical protein